MVFICTLSLFAKSYSKTLLKFFANKSKILREENRNCSRRIFDLFANNFLFVLVESLNALISPLQLDLNARFLLLSSFRFSPSSPSVPPAHM